MITMDSKSVVTQNEFFHVYPKRFLENNFYENNWVTLYRKNSYHPNNNSDIDVYLRVWTYLGDDQHISRSMQSFDSDLEPSEKGALYMDNQYAPALKEGFESTIVTMDFYDIRPYRHQIRINEEFIHMFHLYEEIDNNGNRRYTQFDAGDTKVVLIVSEDEVKILHQYLMDFLAARKLNLVCYARSEVNMTF